MATHPEPRTRGAPVWIAMLLGGCASEAVRAESPATSAAAVRAPSAAPVAPADVTPVRTAAEQRVADAITNTVASCSPPVEWSRCEDALDAVRATRAAEPTVSDELLLGLVETERDPVARRVTGALLDDDPMSPVLRKAVLATRLLDAARRETDEAAASMLVGACGNIDLDGTKLGYRVRDLGLTASPATSQTLMARVVRHAATSHGAAHVVGDWLVAPSSTFVRLVHLAASTAAADPSSSGTAFCAAMLEVAKEDPLRHRPTLAAVRTACTEAQQRADAVQMIERPSSEQRCAGVVPRRAHRLRPIPAPLKRPRP